ncbi:MAG TPA: ABC transporter permease [Holophagaceae bacterium]|nr:ABC transporter permease [Holophagaceae bacterium]
MSGFSRQVWAEWLKLKRSPALRLVWLLPLLFIGFEFLVFERHALARTSLSEPFSTTFDWLQIQVLGSVWGGFFHPLMVALIPALVFRPEHRFKQWRHLYSLPVPRRGFFLAKAVVALALCAGSLALVWLGFWIERSVLGWLNPLLRFPHHDLEMAKVLGWFWIGSLPLLALYLWVSDRINSMAVPLVFGLIGLLLTVSLSGQELNQPWRRDLIPWVLPYFAAQGAIRESPAGQSVHLAATPFKEEPNILRLPSGRKIRTQQPVPDEVLFPPPPPTPQDLFLAFSLGAGAALLGLGFAAAGRRRL